MHYLMGINTHLLPHVVNHNNHDVIQTLNNVIISHQTANRLKNAKN